jgi:RNA polymerase sigma-70 factor (ECF subfamily)
MDDQARRARDAWLAYRCQLGEPEGFALLIDEMERPLYYYVLKLLGSDEAVLDVLQEVWLKVFRTIRHIRHPEALRTWLYRIARGTALNHVRDERAWVGREEALGEGEESEMAGTEPKLEDALAVHHALDRLDRAHREVLVLLFVEGLTVEEIAGVLQCPPGTVKSRVHHAKSKLRHLLGGGPHA